MSLATLVGLRDTWSDDLRALLCFEFAYKDRAFEGVRILSIGRVADNFTTFEENLSLFQHPVRI